MTDKQDKGLRAEIHEITSLLARRVVDNLDYLFNFPIPVSPRISKGSKGVLIP